MVEALSSLTTDHLTMIVSIAGSAVAIIGWKLKHEFEKKKLELEKAETAARKAEATLKHELEKQKLELDQKEASSKKESYFVQQVLAQLQKPFAMPAWVADDIGGLPYIDRDPKHYAELKRTLSVPGCFALLEGPSGCGKTTTVRHAMVDRNAPGFFFSVRDNSLEVELKPLDAFAHTFGLADLPEDQHQNQIRIVKKALQQHRMTKPDHALVPLLVIDDVQQLLDHPHGLGILQFTLGAAQEQLLSVVFVASEPVAAKMQQLSGFKARLGLLSFDYLSPQTLIDALTAVKHPNPTFTQMEAALFIEKCGSHMSDLRNVQHSRTNSKLSVEEAITLLIDAETTSLHQLLTDNLKERLSDASILERMRPQLAMRICDVLAEADGPVLLSKLTDAVESGSWSPECKAALKKGYLVPPAVGELVKMNVLRHSHDKGDESLAFHRPATRTAYLKLKTKDAFIQARAKIDEVLDVSEV